MNIYIHILPAFIHLCIDNERSDDNERDADYHPCSLCNDAEAVPSSPSSACIKIMHFYVSLLLK